MEPDSNLDGARAMRSEGGALKLGHMLFAVAISQTALVMAQPDQPEAVVPPPNPFAGAASRPAPVSGSDLDRQAAENDFVGPPAPAAGPAGASGASQAAAGSIAPPAGGISPPPGSPYWASATAPAGAMPLPALPGTGAPLPPAQPGEVIDAPLPEPAVQTPPALTRDLLTSEIPLGPSSPVSPDRSDDARSPGAALVSNEKPLLLAVSTPAPGQPRTPGDSVRIHIAASAPAYFVVVQISEAGEASTLFRSSSPIRNLDLSTVLRSAGRHYLVALASVYPPRVDAVSDALSASGAGNAMPASLWRAALSQASRSGLIENASQIWQRFHWATAIESFSAVRPAAPAAPLTTPPAAPAPAAVQKSPAPASSLIPEG